MFRKIDESDPYADREDVELYCADCFGEIRNTRPVGDEWWHYCADCNQYEGETVELTEEEREERLR